MRIELHELLGVFIYDYMLKEEDYIHDDALHIYQNEEQTLCFSYLYHSEDNHDSSWEYEEGIVDLEPDLREIHFKVRESFSWNHGGGCGYDTTSYQHRVYDEGEYTATFRLIRRKELYFKNESSGTYKRVNDERQFLYGRESEIIERMEDAKPTLANWNHNIKSFIASRLKSGWDLEEIASATEWTIEEIQDFQKTLPLSS